MAVQDYPPAALVGALAENMTGYSVVTKNPSVLYSGAGKPECQNFEENARN